MGWIEGISEETRPLPVPRAPRAPRRRFASFLRHVRGRRRTLRPVTEEQGNLRPLFRLAIPVLCEQLLVLAVSMSDHIITGKYLDTPHLAAINSAAYLLWLSYGIFSFIAIGSTAMVARFVGAGREASARRVVNQSMVVGGGLAVFAAVFWWLGADAIIGLLRLEGETAELAGQYMRIVMAGVPFIMLAAVGIACFRGAGDMVIGMVIMGLVNTVNCLVSWSLVLGLGPLPQLGWRGIAWGTFAGYVVGGLLVVALLMAGRSGLHLEFRRMKPDFPMIRRLLRVGIPGGLDMMTVIGCQLWFLSLVNHLGTLAAAAHGLTLRIESTGYIPGAAFQLAATTLAGQFLGAKDPKRAASSVLTALFFGGGFMTFMGVLYFVFASELPYVFLKSSQTEVAATAAPLLRIVSLAMPSLAVMMIVAGGLRGAGDTRWPMAISLVGFLGVRIPGTYILAFSEVAIPGTSIVFPGFGMGIVGAWIALVVDVNLRALLLGARFWHGGWKRVQV